jgi:NAD(P)-dependent dehydrogenase (short-subunit alcohol dehydrogenase family)
MQVSAGWKIEDGDIEDWEKTLAVNLTGPMLIIRAAIPYLRKSPAASVVNISSVAGRRRFPGMAAYSAAKAGLIMLTQQAAMDYGAENIRFNAVCPGWVRTAARMQGSAPRFREAGRARRRLATCKNSCDASGNAFT